MDRITPQKTRTFRQVVLALLSHDDPLEAKLLAAAESLHQDPREQATYPTESIQDNILGFVS